MKNTKNNIKQTFDQRISDAPLLKEKDKARFEQWLRKQKHGKKKSYWLPQLITALLLFGFVSLLYVANESTLSDLFKNDPAEEAFKDYFHQYMQDFHEVGDYQLINQEVGVIEEDDAIAIFKAPSERGEQELLISYFSKDEEQWYWSKYRQAEWEDPVVWSSKNTIPYIYTAVTSDQNISSVMIDGNAAEMIPYGNDNRLWYATSTKIDAEVSLVTENGRAQIIDEIPVPEPLLAESKGKMSFLYVSPDGNAFESPEFMKELDDQSEILDRGEYRSLGGVQTEYPSLGLEKAPYYMFFDTEKILLETSDQDEAASFIEDVIHSTQR